MLALDTQTSLHQDNSGVAIMNSVYPVFLDLVIPYGVFHTTIIIIRILEIGPVTIQI